MIFTGHAVFCICVSGTINQQQNTHFNSKQETGYWNWVQYVQEWAFITAWSAHTVQMPMPAQGSVYCSVVGLCSGACDSIKAANTTGHLTGRQAIITGRTRQKIHPDTFCIKECADSRPGFELHGAVRHTKWVNTCWKVTIWSISICYNSFI